jgi:DNA excision repair protein ERCC-4
MPSRLASCFDSAQRCRVHEKGGLSLGFHCGDSREKIMPAYVMPSIVPRPDTGALSDATLPGLRGLAKLADLRPIIVVDQREQDPLVFTHFTAIPGTLYSGDYSIAGLETSFAIERKSIDDLASCCLAGQRDRLEHELHRLRGYRFKRLLVVGTREDIAAGHYHSRIAPKSVLATLGAFEMRYDLPVVFAETPENAAREIERWTWWFAREVVENANDLLRGSRLD